MTPRTLAGKLLLLPLTIENWLVLAVGLAGATCWLTGELLQKGSHDPWGAVLVSSLDLFRRVTISFLIFGGLAWALRWIRIRFLSAPLGSQGAGHPPWFVLVVVILAVHGALAATFAHPLLLVVEENIRLLQNWGVWEGIRHGGPLSGIYLVPVLGILMTPGLAVMTAFAFIAGAAAALGYLILGLEDPSRVILRAICLQLAFLLGLFFTLDFFDGVIRIAKGMDVGSDFPEWQSVVLPWLTGQMAQCTPVAQRLAWLLPGFFLCAAIFLRKAHQRGFAENNVAMQIPEKVPVRIPELIPVPESTPIGWSGSVLETDERFQHETYLIKYKFFSNPFFKDFDVYASDNQLVFTARMSGLNLLTRQITVYQVGKERSEILSISGRRFIGFPNSFDMKYCPTNQRVAIFRNSPDGWTVMDEYGRQIARLAREEALSGAVKCRIMMGHLSVCEYKFQNMIRPIVMIHFPDEFKTIFGKKTGIGLALILGFQSVAFNRTYSG